MIVIGCVLIPVVMLWEIKFARHPIMPYRFFKNPGQSLAYPDDPSAVADYLPLRSYCRSLPHRIPRRMPMPSNG